VLKDHVEKSALRALKVTKEIQGSQVHKVLAVILGPKVLRETRGIRDP
jgi:hypothetical protein